MTLIHNPYPVHTSERKILRSHPYNRLCIYQNKLWPGSRLCIIFLNFLILNNMDLWSVELLNFQTNQGAFYKFNFLKLNTEFLEHFVKNRLRYESDNLYIVTLRTYKHGRMARQFQFLTWDLFYCISQWNAVLELVLLLHLNSRVELETSTHNNNHSKKLIIQTRLILCHLCIHLFMPLSSVRSSRHQQHDKFVCDIHHSRKAYRQKSILTKESMESHQVGVVLC